MRVVVRFVGAVVLALAAVAACDESATDGNGAEGDPADCDAIATRCHSYVTSSNPVASECHDIGHEGPPADCTARKAECLAACPETSGSGGSAGSGGGGTGGSNGGGGSSGGGGTPTGGSGTGAQGGTGTGATVGSAGAGAGAGAGGSAATGGMGATAGASGSAGSGGTAGAGAGACAEYCDCMDEACSTVTGYPLGTTSACLLACADFTEAERACWAFFCEEARTTAEREHTCMHAWGGHDLDECP